MPATVEVSVLGAVELRREGRPLDLGAPKQRALVAGLALARGWPVSVDALVDLLWGDHAPPGVTGTLQAYVSQLRRVIEPDRAPRTPASVLVTASAGYALKVPEEAYDVHQFEHAVLSAHRQLQPLMPSGPAPLPAEALEQQVAALDAALARWRGTPYAELGDADDARAERSRLQDLRLLAVEDRSSALLALGDHATQAAELEALTLTHPLRERLWALRAVALARSGRQADALEVLRRVREVLDEELGIEPSVELRDLQTALLRQDERLDWRPPPRSAAAPSDRPAGAAPGAAATTRRPEDQQVAPWPMVGRDLELAALVTAAVEAAEGRPRFAVLTGEPGIGKSRLAAELLLQARGRGARTVVGRCSQDEGAPPLWPWQSVLQELGADLVALVGVGREDEGAQFRAWERVAGTVRAAAAERSLVVLLEDLHWADASTLRVLRLLVESVADERLMVVGSWRTPPAPTGLLADVAEAFARRHATWVALDGLTERDVRTVYEAVSHRSTAPPDAGLLLTRTDGNPFFVVELARLAAERGGGVDLAAGRLPTAVGEVIDRRLARLPERTVDALRVAAVIGRRFDLTTLAHAARIDEDEALDVVEPAQAIGLLRDHGIDHYLFAHALVRDRLREGASATRRARLHARVAAALDRLPGRQTEAAEHWRHAGPAHAGRAWRSALAAAEQAARLHDHEQAAVLLGSALESQELDPTAGDAERLDLLMRRIEAHRWTARLPELVAAAEEAIGIARRLEDVEALARAAISASHGVLWRSAPPGRVNPVVLDALHDVLAGLPQGDSELRCRVLLALAMESEGGASDAELAAYVEQALAMARRLRDPGLTMSAAQVGFVSQWAPATAVVRRAMISEAVELARATGDERGYVVSATLRTVVLSELGHVAELWRQLQQARDEAARLRIPFGELILTGLETSWLAMAGRFDDCEQNLARLARLGERLAHEEVVEATGAARLGVAYWRPDPDVLVWLDGLLAAGHPLHATAGVYRWRAGDEAGARRHAAAAVGECDLEGPSSPLVWSHTAELGHLLQDAPLAASVVDRLTPLAGRPAVGGSGVALAPVDAYLAMAAGATGRPEDAARHLTDALRLAEEWELPVVVAWLEELGHRLLP